MKFAYAILAAPAVALAAPNFLPPLFRREGITDAAQQVISGAVKAMTCFEIALAKAGGNPESSSGPTPPMGVNCDAIISLVNKGMTSGGMPTPTSSATPSMSATGSSSAAAATSSA